MSAYLLETAVGIFNIIVLYLILVCYIVFSYYKKMTYTFCLLALFLPVVKTSPLLLGFQEISTNASDDIGNNWF